MECLNEIQKMRKENIKSHFEKILITVKSYRQINGFYDRVVWMIVNLLENVEGVYNYEGFNFWVDDILLINLLREEHNLKKKMLDELE